MSVRQLNSVESVHGGQVSSLAAHLHPVNLPYICLELGVKRIKG